MGRQCTDLEQLLQASIGKLYLRKTKKVVFWTDYHMPGTTTAFCFFALVYE